MDNSYGSPEGSRGRWMECITVSSPGLPPVGKQVRISDVRLLLKADSDTTVKVLIHSHKRTHIYICYIFIHTRLYDPVRVPIRFLASELH